MKLNRNNISLRKYIAMIVHKIYLLLSTVLLYSFISEINGDPNNKDGFNLYKGTSI